MSEFVAAIIVALAAAFGGGFALGLFLCWLANRAMEDEDA